MKHTLKEIIIKNHPDIILLVIGQHNVVIDISLAGSTYIINAFNDYKFSFTVLNETVIGEFLGE